MTGSVWQLLIGAAIGVLAAWIALIITLAVIRPRGSSLGESLRLLPDLLRLVRRLAADPSLPGGVRIQLALLLIYLASPIDLIPDFVPVLGYADDAIVVTAVLRSVVRRVGLPAIRAHWPGTDDGLAALARLTGLPTPAPIPVRGLASVVDGRPSALSSARALLTDPILAVPATTKRSATPLQPWLLCPGIGAT